MAGNENSGGYRPTAPQNNTGISATGGAGSKDGQPTRYIAGGKYGEGKALMEQQQGAPMASAPSASAPSMPSNMATAQGNPIGTLMDPSNNPSEPITAGVDFGPGPGSNALPKNIDANTRPDENRAIIQKYLPTLMQAANTPETPDSYKRFINYLLAQQ
jgi:hypothetical protein